MHNLIKLDSSQQTNESANLNFTADMLVVQNLTAKSLLVRVGGLDFPQTIDNADIYVPPFSSITYSVNNTQFAFSLGLPEVSPIPANSPTTALITLSQNEPVPTFSGLPVTSVSAAVSGSVDANITNPSLDTHITNANIPVSGNVNATITNANVPVTGNMNANITNASINASVINAALPAGSFFTPLGNTTTIAAPSTIAFNITVPVNSSGIAIISSRVVNNYSVSLNVLGGGGGTFYSEIAGPQPLYKLVPLLNMAGTTTYTINITDNVGVTTFSFYSITGSLPILIQPTNGYLRTQSNIVSTGRSGYQANTAVSAVTTRFSIAAAAAGQVLVIDSIFGDTGPNLTSNTAAYIRLQTSDATPIILFEMWSPFTAKDVIHAMLPGPMFIPPGISLNCVTNNGSTGTVLQSCTVTYHYQIQ